MTRRYRHRPTNTFKRRTSCDAAPQFLGRFGKTAPPAPLLRTQVGYEIFKWVMLFGEGELAFTDTSKSQDPPKTRAFPIFGFGGGARFTARFTDRLGAYLQGSLGAMKADIRFRLDCMPNLANAAFPALPSIPLRWAAAVSAVKK